ncbi:protein-export membrane protein SecF [Candidatus Roizmanbacteria bacterium RIFCSPLOWO2_01_FULL_37_13]|uniref:Protein-export membrane protein SecF n=1 Tax=Candidatus Roizmanbacteria bacterium RIFCSPHIGHO2_02_FULL_38_11 TaxID=1802039 RepID=A0A1F7H3P0_9BACT|nr:MAG: protein-export membrane protein SecF [Candidatus Roizmanbacteria bacterium RIFCSPHIGHO2_02_FULL_38_11]OGK33513.1 MAG: protein-export membrane protein SecF [Candidatus Roizmanbacteria bacterium RIFCSPHIGHO2_12_FULL_37_9b]OGK41431.1 MAG: protein-export membrane protein SecF [Candidatus Roizmanbacteria bacterium RIFCSPLOWO2_01_FULL_37_13]
MVSFLKYKWLYFLISAVVIGAGIFSMVFWGFRYSIDFVGGTNIEYAVDKKIGEKQLKDVLKEYKIEALTILINDKKIAIRSKSIDEQKELKIRNYFDSKFKTKATLLLFETVGPVIGKETIRKTTLASLLALLGILLYMSFTFKSFYFALSAILALIHDFLVVIGTYSLFSHFFGAEVDLLFVTALLTTMSFSVHDTIVIFDKIREYGTRDKSAIEYYANKALSETLVRSLNNSMTIIFMLLALILLGGSTIRFFVAALLVGTLTGTYSSPFVATPILVWLEKRKKR